MANYKTGAQRYNDRMEKIWVEAKKNNALRKIEEMTDEEFTTFFAGLPERVKMLVKAGMCDWKEVLPQYVPSWDNLSGEEKRKRLNRAQHDIETTF